MSRTSSVILIPSFRRKLEKIKDRTQLKIIERMKNKLERMGKNALNVLDVQEHYLLGEMKVMRPPYRLYIIVDQNNDMYYLVEWEHKEKQEKVINELKGRLSRAIKLGLDKIFI
jgi:mRNA-degrading endonuclease RelE of RelBE toxin-antitoxin system